MRADRGVDAAGPVPLRVADHLGIERLAHAVQALELVLAAIEIRTGHDHDRGQRLGVMGRELREDRVRRGEELPRAGEIRDVRVDLAGIDGEIGQPVGLGALDLAVPIGALHEPHHDAALRAAGEVDEPVDDEGAAPAIGLDDEADAVPGREIGIEAEGFQEVEGDFEAVGLLGVDVEADVVLPGQEGEALHARQQFAHDAPDLGADIARMQRGELDRDAGPLVDAPSRRRLADGVDGGLVIGEVARRILGRGRRLAQHVVGIAEAPCLHGAAVRERLLDGLAGHELLAHHPHGDVDALADQRLAAPADESREGRGQARLVRRGGEAAGHDQAPGRRVHEERGRMAEMGAPVAGRDLVADQRVAGRLVRDAQQCLGEAHQGDALVAGERIFVDEPLDAAMARLGAERLDQRARDAGGGLGSLGRQGRGIEERGDAVGFRAAIGGRDRVAERRLRLHPRGEGGERSGGGGHGRLSVGRCLHIGLSLPPFDGIYGKIIVDITTN